MGCSLVPDARLVAVLGGWCHGERCEGCHRSVRAALGVSFERQGELLAIQNDAAELKLRAAALLHVPYQPAA